MKNGFHITKLDFVGGKKRSSIILNKGLNVIYGPTGTGKSFMFDSINFMLGSKDCPEEIDEIKDFKLIQMEIKSNKGEVYTLQRSIEGGSFKKFECQISSIKGDTKFEVLGSTNSAKKSVSKFLLSLSGFKDIEYQIKKNANNNLQRFSYRGMNHLIMADEVRIITKRSPVYSGVLQSKTSEKSIFKFLLTNSDDSQLKIETKELDDPYKKIKLDLIQNIIEETKNELKKMENKEGEFKNLSEEIKVLTSLKDGMLEDIEKLTLHRSEIWKEIQFYSSRELSINALMRRFSLLKNQYDSDLERLIFLSEGSHYFNQLSFERCPVCHKELDKDEGIHEEHLTGSNDKAEAVKVEISKINKNKTDLEQTVSNIEKELEQVRKAKEIKLKEYETINQQIAQELQPNLNKINQQLDKILRKHTEYNQLVFLEDNLKKLEIKKKEIETLEVEKDPNNNAVKDEELLIKNHIKDLCDEIAEILTNWDFPHGKEVSFDFTNYDIFIGDKKRSLHGKGYRAIAFSAFLLGLMKYCFGNDLPHTGMVILDSPLTAYKKKDKPEDKLPEEIQHKFYEHLSKLNYQIIVFENKKPQAEIIDNINFIEFTQNGKSGRFGFIEN